MLPVNWKITNVTCNWRLLLTARQDRASHKERTDTCTPATHMHTHFSQSINYLFTRVQTLLNKIKQFLYGLLTGSVQVTSRNAAFYNNTTITLQQLFITSGYTKIDKKLSSENHAIEFHTILTFTLRSKLIKDISFSNDTKISE